MNIWDKLVYVYVCVWACYLTCPFLPIFSWCNLTSAAHIAIALH